MNNNIQPIYVNARNEIEQYCANLPMGKMIDDQSFIDRNPYIYLLYPHLFNDVFGYTNELVLSKLTVAGFLLYRSIIIKDAYLDNDNKSMNNKNYILVKDICQEEALRLLFQLFGTESEFWFYWNLRRNEYHRAEEIDKQSSHLPFDRHNYELLADYKSTFGKLAIDALHVLSHKQFPDKYDLLIQSHAQFSAGLQIYDDTKDMEEDYRNGQFNWAYSNLPKYHENAEINEIKKLKKHFFVSGTAQKAYRESISYFDQAAITVKDCNCPHWLDVIDSRKSKVLLDMHVLEEYLTEIGENV